MSKDPNKPQRITMSFLLGEMASAFNFDRGISYTLKMLLIDPHALVYEYLYTNRRKALHPLRFILLTTAIFVFLNNHYLLEDLDSNLGVTFTESMNTSDSGKALQENTSSEQILTKEKQAAIIFDLYQRFLNFAYLLFVPIIAFFAWVFFRKSKLNYAEQFVSICYVGSFQNVIFFLCFPLIWKYQFGMALFVLLGLTYSLYFYTSVYQQRILPGMFKGLLTNAFAMILYSIIISVSLLLYIPYAYPELISRGN